MGALLKNILANTDIGGGTLFKNVSLATNFDGLGPLKDIPANTVTSITSATVTVPLFVIWGQSNATGFGQVAGSLPTILSSWIPNVYIWNYDATPKQPQNLKAFVNNNFGSQLVTPYFGPEMNMTYLLGQQLNKIIYVVKFTANGTSMETYWKPSLALGYSNLLSAINDAIAYLAANGKTAEIKAIYGMQGESDAINDQASADAYYTNRTAFNTAIKSDLGLPNLHDVFGRIQHVGTWEATVRAAQDQFAADDPTHNHLINTDAYPVQGDLLHFTGAAQVTQGLDAFNIIKTFY